MSERRGKPSASPVRADAAERRHLARRHRADRRFKLYAKLAVGVALAFLVFLFADIIRKGAGAFLHTEIRVPIELERSEIPVEDPADANYRSLLRDALVERFPEASGRSDRRELAGLVSATADFALRDLVAERPELVGSRKAVWLPSSDEVDLLVKGEVSRDLPAQARRLSDRQLAWLEELEEEGAVRRTINVPFFTHGDSREPESAGILGATVGSLFTMLITLAISFPLGVATAVYLEEFAPKNRWIDLIEVNINNLAAVPSIVFGLLGLAVFLNFFGLPRSAPLVGGLVLSLMTLPIIIITSRVALQSVPPSIRTAAYGLGATPMQVIAHHVLPLALPGILTGTIIGMARALGETAPLLMIGMVAFVVDVPEGPLDPATVLPVQIFLWADSPERAFVEKTSAAILVLLAFLILMNAAAVWLRRRSEKRF